MGKINSAWHAANRMPEKPTDAERADWHHRHALACDCRAVTASIAESLQRHGYEVPRKAG